MHKLLLASSALVAVAAPAAAQDATWLANPATGDFNTAGNWTPGAVPTGTAIFGASNTTTLTFSATTNIGGWTFNSGASNYTFNNTVDLAFTGAGITVNGGSARINNINNSLTFLNTSTAGNATILNEAIVTFKGASTAGNADISNPLANHFVFFTETSTAGNATITTGGNVFFSGTATAGNATINDNGTVEFSNASTAGNATINNGSTLSFINAASAGNATITTVFASHTDFRNASNASNATITNVASSNLNFHDTSTAGSASIINNGNLTFVDDTTAGSSSIVNHGSLTFDFRATAGSASIITSGGGAQTLLIGESSGAAARFIVNGGGFLNFSSHVGNVAVGSIEGDGQISLSGILNFARRNLAVGGNNLSTTFSGRIQDGGVGSSLTKVGTGTLTLSGNNTYTGATTINGGALQVDGSIATSSGVVVNNSGTLSGSGTVGATTINSGGILAPGAGSATTSLAISGNLAFQSGALYHVQLNAAGQSSKATVTGNAALNGATVHAILAPGAYTKGQNFTILSSSNPISGTFAGVSVPNFMAGLDYTTDPTKVILTLTGLALGNAANLNATQQNVASAINNFFNSGGALPPGFAALAGLSGNSFTNALTQASGETAVGSQQTTFNAMNQFMGVLTDPFIDGRGGNVAAVVGANGYADDQALGYTQHRNPNDALGAIYTKAPPRALPFEQRWSVWASGFGGSQTTDGNTALGSNTATSRLFGTAVGADYLLSPNTIAGFALAGGGTNFSVANGGTGRSDLFQAGAFVSHHSGAAYVTGALAYGWQEVTTDRTLTAAGIDHLHAEFNANALSGRLEGGYRFFAPWTLGVGFTPYAAAQVTAFDLPSYAESVISGTNTFALSYSSKTVTDSRSELGFRTDKSYPLPNAVLTLRGRFAWAHDFNPDHAIAATIQTLPGASFVVNGAASAHDSALTTASAELKWLNGWSVATTFEGEFSEVTRSYAGKGVVRYQW